MAAALVILQQRLSIWRADIIGILRAALVLGFVANATSALGVTPGTPMLSLEYVGGNGQIGAPLATLPAPLTVQIQSSGDIGSAGTASIVWTVTAGTATIVESGGQSYSQSVSYLAGPQTHTTKPVLIHLALGATPGPVTVQATCAVCKQLGVTYGYTATYSQNFDLTIVQPSLQIVSGNNQTGLTGAMATSPLAVQLTANGAPAAGQTVTWAVASGQATLSAASSVTDSNGNASINFTYGVSAGPITIEASAAGTQAAFNVTAATPTASTLSGNNQNGIIGATLQPFVVQVSASGTSSLGQLPVNWTVVQGNGTLAAAQTLTDASGRASNTLTLGQNPGVNIVQASVPGAGSISFTANAFTTVAGSSVFAIVSGNNQPLVPLQPSQPLVVKLTSSDGTPIDGAGVQWGVTGATGKLASTSTTTGTDGTSQNVLTVILPGSYTVTAQIAGASGLPTLTFTFANGVANLPGLSPSQVGVAASIDKACPALATSTAPLTPAQQDFLQRCSELVVGSGNNPQQVPGALDAMLNNKALPQRSLAQGVQQGQFSNLNTRFAELRQGTSGLSLGGLGMSEDGHGLPLAMLGDLFRKDPKADDEVGKDFARWGFFATGMIERGGFDATAVRPGFDFHNASLTAGVDYRFNADFVAGVALGYNQNNSSFDASAGKADVDGYSLNGYFSWYHGDYYIEGSLVSGWLDYDLNRNINYQIDSLSGNGLTTVAQTAMASPSGRQDSFSLSAGRDFNRKAWSFSPYLRGVYSHLSLDAFSESMSDPGAPGAGLGTSVAGRSLSSFLGVAGARVSYTTSYDWGVLVPNAVIEWNHEFRNDPQTVVVRFLADPTQTPISLTDAAPDSNYFNVGFGLNAVFAQGRSGYIYYEHMVGFAGAHEDQLSLGIRIEF
ncbi:MAG: autotransporter domain-containing protein [Rudaea sp.]